ncbi:heterokaryon incompatibility protein-domain-containing protein [Immersiella caudata]|uniref:Heterokaryon incompatibility protein-domain-containing protein n=1 Tax=Immersiella caudata TaxID=314043 RepID=A0AA39X2K6_9PEZI|nr:heterokaryon incompatibility protein-domain-containing protein [Immersiella caudata]
MSRRFFRHARAFRSTVWGPHSKRFAAGLCIGGMYSTWRNGELEQLKYGVLSPSYWQLFQAQKTRKRSQRLFTGPGEARRPLNPDRHEIRLLHVLPSLSRKDAIECLLQHVSLDDDVPEYTALSYTWEDPFTPEQSPPASPDREIFINGQPVNIEENAFWALQHLRPRRSTEPLTLWIDAICINQEEGGGSAEKGQQVEMMDMIYKSAAKTVVWLGPARDGSDAMMDLINEMGQPGFQRPPEQAQAMIDAIPFNNRMAFWSRRWWYRVWVLQELFLSKDVYFQCGDRIIPFARIKYEYWLIRAFDLDSLADAAQADRAGRLAQEVYRPGIRGEVPGVSLSEMAHITGTLGASKVRDLVFGLRGLLREKEKRAIRPEYDESLVSDSQVFADVTRHLLLQPSGLSLLQLVRYRAERPADMPSWAPDFRDTNYCWRIPILWTRPVWDDGRGTWWWWWRAPTKAPMWTAGPCVLSLQGISAGKVEEVHHRPEDPCEFDNLMSVVRGTALSIPRNKVDRDMDVEWLSTYAEWHRAIHTHPRTSRSMNSDETLRWAIFAGDERMARLSHNLPQIVVKVTYSLLSQGWAAAKPLDPHLKKQIVQNGKGAALPEDIKSEIVNFAAKFAKETELMTRGRSLAILENGCVALVPAETEKGDHVVVLRGYPVPFALRLGRRQKGAWELIGDCYIHGAMNSEVVRKARRRDVVEYRII